MVIVRVAETVVETVLSKRRKRVGKTRGDGELERLGRDW